MRACSFLFATRKEHDKGGGDAKKGVVRFFVGVLRLGRVGWGAFSLPTWKSTGASLCLCLCVSLCVCASVCLADRLDSELEDADGGTVCIRELERQAECKSFVIRGAKGETRQCSA